MATSTPTNPQIVPPEIIQNYLNKCKGNIERNSKESLEWFRRRISKDSNPNRTSMLNAPNDYKTRKGTEGDVLIGRLYYFHYKAETPGDKELPVYDAFPMIFIFETGKNQNGDNLVWGLNLHYLEQKERETLLYKLLVLKSNKTYTHRTKLKLTWALIKAHVSHKLYEKAVHAYRVDRIKSRLIEIYPMHWEIAAFLNLQKWVHVDPSETIHQSDVRYSQRTRAREK